MLYLLLLLLLLKIPVLAVILHWNHQPIEFLAFLGVADFSIEGGVALKIGFVVLGEGGVLRNADSAIAIILSAGRYVGATGSADVLVRGVYRVHGIGLLGNALVDFFFLQENALFVLVLLVGVVLIIIIRKFVGLDHFLEVQGKIHFLGCLGFQDIRLV